MSRHYSGEHQSFQQIMLGQVNIPMEMNKFGPATSHFAKMSKIWIKDLNFKANITTFKGNIVVYLQDLRFDIKSKPQAAKSK